MTLIDRFFKIKHSIFVVFSYIYLKHNKLENVFHSLPENKIEIDITELEVTSFVIGYFLIKLWYSNSTTKLSNGLLI